VPGRFHKTRTHRLERRAAREECWLHEKPPERRHEVTKPKVNWSYRSTIRENPPNHFSDEFWSVSEEHRRHEALHREWEDIDDEIAMLDAEQQAEMEYQEFLDWQEIEKLERITPFYCGEEDCI
jgi:non-homologous end joining protein Ku